MVIANMIQESAILLESAHDIGAPPEGKMASLGGPARGVALALRQHETKSASQLAKSPCGERQPSLDQELNQAAVAWRRAAGELAVAQKDEADAQLRIDRARWEQARIVAKLYGCWGKHGLTVLAISKRLGVKESTVKWYVGIYKELGGRPDLARRRFSAWGEVYIGLQSALKRIRRLTIAESTQRDLATAVRIEVCDVIGAVVSNRKNRTGRQLRVATKRAVGNLITRELERLCTFSHLRDEPLRLMGRP